MAGHLIHQCGRRDCSFRFPLSGDSPRPEGCPRCGGPLLPAEGPFQCLPARGDTPPGGPEIQVLLDNIRSVYNVGSMFRTADGAGVTAMHLCGMTATPDNPRLAKTALGAAGAITWSHHPNGCDRARELLAAGCRLWALEGGDEARSLADCDPPTGDHPLVLVVGNEVCGVDPAILAICEQRLYIPMQGLKSSLNAAVAFGVALYGLRHRIGPRRQGN